MVFDECGSGSLAIDGETVACVLCCCIFVCGANKGYDEFLDRVEELCVLSQSQLHRLLLGAVLTSSTSSALCKGFSSAGLEGKDVMIFVKNTQWLYSKKIWEQRKLYLCIPKE
jgi:hypothetical protein